MGEVVEAVPELLVVEDDGMHRLVFGAYLRGMSLGVIFAVNGEDAWARLSERSFALVLMDVDLPDVDGLEVTRRLRALEQARPELQRTPVVALTAYGGANDVRRALNAGCDGYLVKPVTRELLRESVSRFASTSLLAPSSTALSRPSRPDTTRLDSMPAGPSPADPMLADPTPELRDEFVAGAAQVVEQLRGALENGRRDEIRRLAHKLRGSSGTFGLAGASAVAAEIEANAVSAEMASLAGAIDRLSTHFTPAPRSAASSDAGS